MSTALGRLAEEKAAEFLVLKGFTVLQQNWRTRWCEIDIVANRGTEVRFVEVKYRTKSSWGSGLDYITAKKLQQMQFAAEFWMARYGRPGQTFALSAIELAGTPPHVVRAIAEIY